VLAFDRSALWGDPDPVPVLGVTRITAAGSDLAYCCYLRRIEMRPYFAALNSHNPIFFCFLKDRTNASEQICP
jgi:hypothetical protein